MLRNFIGGIAVGVANIIPGVSGGTMLVILGLFDRVMISVTNLFKLKNKNRLKDFWFLCQIGIGAVIGLVLFAKVLNFLFANYEIQTYYWFVGLIVFSIPLFMKKEMKKQKVSIIPLLVGIIVIVGIYILSQGVTTGVTNALPELTPLYLVKLVLIGMITGGSMLLPGVSGSMILLIIGEYHNFKALVSSVTDFVPSTLFSLVLIAIGILLGVILSAKLTKYCLEKYRNGTLSLILGLIVASAVVIIPFNGSYNMGVIITSILSFGFGGLVVYALEKITD